VKEPILRGKKEKPVKTEPTWVTDMLGLHKKSGVYKKIATQGLDINNPADHEAIRKITAPVIADLKKAGTITEEQSKILPNYMETVQQGQTTPTLGETTDAQQIPSTSPINGDGSTQSQESQATEDITQAGKGMESGGQGIEAIETGAQEEVAPAVSSVMVKAADSVLQDYKEKPIPRNIGRLRTIAETLELPVTADTPHAEVYDLVARAITPTQDMGRGIQINANEQGIDSVINKAAKQDEVVDEGLQARWIQHAKEGTLHKAEDDVTDFHYDLKTSNPDAHAKAEQVNTQAIKAVEDTKTLAAEKRIAEEGRLEREAKTTNLEAIKKAVEAKQAEGVTTTPITEAAITDTIQEAYLNPEDDNYLSEQGDDFSGYDYPSVAPTSETTEHTAASLSKTLSPEMKRLVASGKAVIHDTAETLPEGKHPGNVQGLTTAEGVTHYVANKLTPETLENVALHEVGTHVGMENLVGAKVYKDIAHQALNNVGEVFDKARASIPKDTPTHLRHHEALAYLVENAPNLPVVKKIVSAVRNFARMHLGMKIQLTEADARHLAVKALRRESKTTKRTARKEGTAYSKGVLLAPNGKPSNLNAMQHAQVRTPEFKKWFGDWENAPENASKVVDENGEPLVVYHKTRAFKDFTEFDPTKSIDGWDIHFGTKESANDLTVLGDVSKTRIIPAFLNIKHMPHTNHDDGHWGQHQLIHAWEEYWRGLPIEDKRQVRDMQVSDGIKNNYGSGFGKYIKNKAIDMAKSGTSGGMILPKFMADEMFKYGMTGLSYRNSFEDKGSTSYIVMAPNQIKSAIGNTGAFSAENDDIRYSIKPTKDAQNVGTSLDEANLVQTSDKSMGASVKEGIAEATKGGALTKLRAGWVDKTAGLSRALRNLPMFDKSGALRADMLIQANEQLYNVIRNSDGYLVFAGDGTLMSVTEKRLALSDIFKRIDALGYKNSRKTFFTAMRVLTGEQSLLKDVERRTDAKLYKEFADVLQKDMDKLTGALVDAKRLLEAAITAKDAVQIKDLRTAISDINKEIKSVGARAAKLKEESNRLYARHGTKSAVDIQADIDAKVAKAEKKEALAATTTDKAKRDSLLDQVERLRNDVDRLAKVLEKGVGTEKLVTPEQIAEVKDLLAKDPRLEPIMGDIWEGLRKLVDLWEVEGLVDSTIANDWRDNPSYIPLYKSMDDLLDDPSGYVEILKVGAKQLGEVKARKGSMQSVNVGENLIKHQAFMAGAAAQNAARRVAVAHMEQMNPDNVYKTPDASDPQATMFRVNGEKVYYHISDPVAFEAFQSLLPLTPGWIMKTAQAHTKVFRAVTLINPLYWYRQLIRDPMMASLVTQSGLITPLHAAVHMVRILTGLSKDYRTLKKHGIVGAVDSLADPKQFIQGIAAKRGIVRKGIDVLMHIHESTDAATRVAVYSAAYEAAPKKGIVDPQQRENYAVMQAREVINFSKKGNSRKLAAIRSTVPFFSAQLNGMDTLARAAMPGSYGNLNEKDARAVRKHFYANAAMITTASILYALQMDDDDEYKKSPDWMNSWLVPTGNKDNPFGKIPIPFEAGFFFKVIPELLVRVSKYSLTPTEGLEAALTGAKNVLLPPMLPQLLKPLLEVVTNHDFHTGNNIESFTESRLPLNQRTAHATPLAEKIAEGVPGFLNMSPDKIEHLGKGWLTEAWALSALLADAYLSTVTGVSAPTKQLGEKFLWKGVLTAPAKDSNVSRYYDMNKEVEQLVNGIRAYKQVGDKEEAKALRDEPENAKLRKMAPLLGAIGEQIGTIQGRIARIKNKPDAEMSPDEKATRIRVLQEKINILADRAVKRADEKGVER